jgi:Protein of unknown function (DUF3072)
LNALTCPSNGRPNDELQTSGGPELWTGKSVYQFEQSMNGGQRSSAMTSKNAEPRQSDNEINPKIDPAPNSNTEKEPDDWVSGGDPMTGAQASYLKTLSEEVGEPDDFNPGLTKAEASKRIDALKSKRTSAQNP